MNTPPTPNTSAPAQSQGQSLAPPAAPCVLDGYATLLPGYNELIDPQGRLRPAYGPVVNRFNELGPGAIHRRWAAAQRVIQENGVTYNVYGDPRGMHRPWALDPVPMVITAAEWAGLEGALIQRAELLNLLLADLYGPCKLLGNRSLPSDLVFANPNYLRPCVNLRPYGGKHLTLLAFDLARNADGKWWVINDRTQAPSGAGYALENRLLISRILPDLFGQSGVSRLALFFFHLRQTLVRMSPRRIPAPHIVVLTPGPHNETYFEHAYLARYMGFTLVEGGDLTVRGHKVFLKTLNGLQQVDVILRRTDDGFCDPLELRGDSALGVAGLVRAAAAGNVAIANALGSGLVETHSVMPFLPALCREVLGEELKLPSVATWWCGQPKELAYVMDNLTKLVIKPAFAGDPLTPVFGASLAPAALEELRARIRDRPHRYVAQESVKLSTVPVWRNEGFSPRHVMLRVYVAATQDSYEVMPGGLARVSAEQDSMIVTMQHGGGSKDAWVLSDRPVSSFTMLPLMNQPVEVSRSAQNLPSRVADSLYWLGRYVERAEALTQVLRATLVRLTEETSPYGSPELPRLLQTLAKLTLCEPPQSVIDNPLHTPGDTAQYLSAIVFDRALPGSLRSCVGRAQQLGSIVRDRITLDTWRVVSQIEQSLNVYDQDPNDPTTILASLDGLIVPLLAFSGLNYESMIHGPGWRFLDMGRRVERAQALVTELKALLVEPDDNETMVLDAFLSIANSEMTYRSRYRMSAAALPAIDLLVMDESNPRGLAFQLAQIEAHVAALPRDVTPGQRPDEERLVMAMLAALRLADLDDLATPPEAGARHSLAKLLGSLEAQLPEFSDLIVQRYLVHAQSARSLFQPTGDAYDSEEGAI